jgi:pimeloyl-ACP methyl ester carboxylesterase
MKKVYFISGLGGDKRVFSFLDLDFCEPVFVEWIEPFKKESLESYALRLLQQIPDSDPTVVGVSFGGMLVTEMARHNPGIKGILISSNKTAREFPSYLRIGKYLPAYRWIPARIANHSAYAVKWILGKNGREQKKLLLQIIRDMDIHFVRWAIDAIMHWKNEEAPPNVVHIHGTADILLPYRKVKADYTVAGGNHVMVMDSPVEVSAILKKLVG